MAYGEQNNPSHIIITGTVQLRQATSWTTEKPKFHTRYRQSAFLLIFHVNTLYLHAGLPSGLFLSDFSSILLHVLLFFAMCATYSAHLILLKVITLIILSQ
jgi:hypothetical protein